MAEERGAEAKDEKTLNIDAGGKPLNAEEYDKDSGKFLLIYIIFL